MQFFSYILLVTSKTVILDELSDIAATEVNRPKWFEVRGYKVSSFDFNDRPNSMISRDMIEWMISKKFVPWRPDNEADKYESGDEDSVTEMVAVYYDIDDEENDVQIIEDDLKSSNVQIANSPETGDHFVRSPKFREPDGAAVRKPSAVQVPRRFRGPRKPRKPRPRSPRSKILTDQAFPKTLRLK